jgi:membrane fusion protein (multidrug efflux system)
MENNSNKIKIIFSFSITALVLVLAIVFFKRNAIYTDNAYLKADIVIIKPKVTGYITEILVSDNQRVTAGEIVAKVDDRDYQLKMQQAEANLKAVNDKLSSLLTEGEIKDLEIDKALHQRNSAKVSFELADKDFQRAVVLLKDKAISQQEFDKKTDLQSSLKTLYLVAESNYQSAILAKEKNISEKSEAENLVLSAKANLDLAKIDLENTIIKAATDGVVTKRTLQVGQLVFPQNAVAYLVQNNIWVEANFKETQIANIAIGYDVVVTVDSVPGKKFRGKIDSFSPATGSEFSILPPENATGNFTKIVKRVPVKITFENNQDLSQLKSGLSCEVKVEY